MLIKDKIVIIWSEGFPYKHSASNEKNFLIAKSLMNVNIDVILVSKTPFRSEYHNEGIFDGVAYKNFSLGDRKRKYLKYFFAIISELSYLKKLKKEYNSVFLFYSYIFFPIVLLYALFGKLYKFKLVLNIMEWHVAVFKKLSIHKRLNSYLFDNFSATISSGVIVISSFIAKKLNKQISNDKIILIPALCDMNKIACIPSNKKGDEGYILYCGSIGYYEVISFIVKCYMEIQQEIHQNLVLIIHGDIIQIDKLRKWTESLTCSSRIKIYNSLLYNDLIAYYKSSDILLIPLRDTDQDKARYPQKIAEYAACGVPIISNKIGQVGIDFEHKKNIYFSEDFSSKMFIKSISEVLKNRDLANEIGNNALLIGKNYFDCYVYSKPLKEFLNRVEK